MGERLRRRRGSLAQHDGASSPAIDAILDALVAARTHDDHVAAARALDRLLLSGFYSRRCITPARCSSAHASKLRHPDRMPKFPMLPFNMLLDTWWMADN